MSSFSQSPRLFSVLRFGLVAAFLLLFSGEPLQAQLFRGFISGTITDPQNAAIAEAQVTVTNQETSVSQTTMTSELGFYRFVALDPGVYTLEIRKAGFQDRRVSGITVTTAQERQISTSLSVSGGATEINVTTLAGAELAKTNATIERTLPGRTVEEVPVTIERNLLNRFSLLSPLVSRTTGQNEFSVNGQRPRNSNFTLDGVENNDNTVTLVAARTPPEAVQEEQIQVVNYSAEFGRNSGAQVNLITKSGTNTIHGETWDYYRANWLEPLSLVNRRGGFTETPRFLNNQFGADIGGPIVRNKTFFYGLFQGNLRRQAPDATSSQAATIPTPAGYAALLTSPLGSGQSAASRQAVLNALAFLPDIHALVKSYDNVKNVTVNSTPIEVGTIRFLVAQPQNIWYSVGRADHNLTANDKLSYRFHMDNRHQINQTGNLQFGDKWSANQNVDVGNHALSYTHIFGPHMVSESRAGYLRQNLDFPEKDPVSSTVGLGSGFFQIGGNSAFPQFRLDQVYQYQNVNTWLAGRNSIKFGFDVRHNVFRNRLGTNSKGTWSFSGLENFMNNTATSLVQAVTEAQSFSFKQNWESLFFQNDFAATRNLTLNLGLRYETNSVPFGNFGTTDPAQLAIGIPGPTKRDRDDWAPKFGFAYSPNFSNGFLGKMFGNGRTAIRGGFGISYDIWFYNNIINTASSAYPRSVTQTDNGLVDVFPALLPKTAAAPALNPLGTFINIPVDAQNPVTNYWSLSLQRSLGQSFTLELGYSGNRSYHQLRQGQANPATLTAAQAATVIAAGNSNGIPSVQNRRVNPLWGSRTLILSDGNGLYHAGYIRIDKRFSHGLSFGANYTYSATLSDSEEVNADSTIAPSSPQVPQDFFNLRNEWARSIFDRPHRLAVHYQYEVPWFQNGSEALRQVFGGWQVSGFSDFQSGQPFTMRVGVDTVGNSASSTFPPGRPDYNPTGILTKDPVSGDLRTFKIPLDDSGIITAPHITNTTTGAITFLANSMPLGGNLGRNTFRGPSFQNWNLSLLKSISLPREIKLQLRSDFINLLNHDNFQPPDAVMSSPTFGQNNATPITDARQVMVSAKIRF